MWVVTRGMDDADRAHYEMLDEATKLRKQIKALEAENARLRARLFSLACSQCPGEPKGLYCSTCGKAMAYVKED
jgi:hypothetical protein